MRASVPNVKIVRFEMTSHGKNETEKLKENLELQLDRLITQLDDLENCKDDLDEDEYRETKQDTMEQLKEFNESLGRLIKGDVSLISSIGAIQLATRAAISQAFRTPEVIRLFGRREPKLLRDKLCRLDQDWKLGKIDEQMANKLKCEILNALRQLGERLAAPELQFLDRYGNENDILNIEFIKVANEKDE